MAWLTLLFVQVALAQIALPAPPQDPNHPGSENYAYSYSTQDITCNQRTVSVYLPQKGPTQGPFPVVVYGHGQALDKSNYDATFQHLAKKGVAVIFPAYDKNFFDQEWQRMGSDYVTLTDCALAQFAQMDAGKVIYAGHSKGAYVASIAAGLAKGLAAHGPPRASLFFEPAGADAGTLATIDPSTSLTVIFADQDTIVSQTLSQQIYDGAPNKYKQFIHFSSYMQTTPQLKADHFWPVTAASPFGGGPVCAFHYYGEWKWLVAAALDLNSGGHFDNPYLYGQQALDKGLSGAFDSVTRNW